MEIISQQILLVSGHCTKRHALRNSGIMGFNTWMKLPFQVSVSRMQLFTKDTTTFGNMATFSEQYWM
jgi:hypothetical protein